MILEMLAEALYHGRANEVTNLTRRALAENISALQILQDGLLRGMDRVGCEFKAGELFLPEVIASAKAMHAGLSLLRPLLAQSPSTRLGRVVIGTVQGDLHDIGKNLVAMMLEGAGFEVIDLGVDVTATRFEDAVRQFQPDLLGLSALLTTTMPEMPRVIAALDSAGLRRQVKVMIGGAPVTQHFADEIGADGYAPNAPAALELAKRLQAYRIDNENPSG